MALVIRLFVVLAALLAASMTAALVITLGVLIEWKDALVLTGSSTGWFVVSFFGLIVSGKGLLLAMLAIALTEALRIRSVLLYAAAGGAGLVALYYGAGLAERGSGSSVLVGRDVEIMAGAGIAAGFVYWMIAGRKAGAWRESDT
jgi:hypothetical protein